MMFDFLLQGYKSMPAFLIFLEIICFFLGIMSVWYAKKENILVYPTGLISTIITVYLLYISKDIGNMLVNIYFSIMSIYGWYNWKFGKSDNENQLRVSHINKHDILLGSVFAIITFGLVYTIYKFFSYKIGLDTYIDLITTAVFFTAMWYMAKKKLQSWILWIIADIAVTPLYAYRGFYLLSFQYFIFTIIAILAYFEWQKSINQKR